jgi:hypothetical protein
MANYQELENKIQELQKEVERLKQEEASNKLPNLFKIDDVKKLLDTGAGGYIEYAFDWASTSQGYGYWYNIFCADEPLTDKVIIQLQKWVIIYLEQNQK